MDNPFDLKEFLCFYGFWLWSIGTAVGFLGLMMWLMGTEAI